jgi:hypothetical protein
MTARIALATLAAATLIAIPAGAAHAAPRIGLWTGTINAQRERSTNLLSVGTSARGELWFRVGRGGKVAGHATVAFEPKFDADALNDAIDFAKDVGSSAAGLLPWPGAAALVESGVATIVGVKEEFAQSLAVHSGPISGRLANGQLSLAWSGAEPAPIPVGILLDTVAEDHLLATERMPMVAPLDATATVKRRVGRWHAVATNHTSTTNDGVEDESTVAWSARRVGR